MLTAQNICKYYDKNKLSEQCVLKNISLELPETGLVSIFGPSGCGKTTLLNMLAGLDTPTSGTVCYNNIPVTDSFRYNNVGVIFQDYALLENKTVEENIRIGYLDATDQALEDTLKALDISRLKDRRISMLSGGEKQRVSIARALIKKPAYIVADEPTGNLDLKNRMRVMQILKSLSTHILIILVSHDIDLVTKYSDRIITLTDGEVTQDKTISTPETKTSYEVKQGKSKFNLASYLKDTFKIKNKTNFILILFMVALTMLICMNSSNITGYKYQSSSITNNYIRFEKVLPFETYTKIKNQGIFQYDIEIYDLYMPEEKRFSKASNSISIKDATMKLYPYQNEKILYSLDKESETNNPKIYLTKALAKRILKEGRICSAYRDSGFVNLKELYFQDIKDLLGSSIDTGISSYDVVGIVDSEIEGILYTENYFIRNGILPYSLYKKHNPQALEIEKDKVLVLGKYTTNTSIGGHINIGGKHLDYEIKDIYEDAFFLDGVEVKYVVSDYSYYDCNALGIFYTTHLEEVTSILDEDNILYTLPAVENYGYIDSNLNQLYSIFLSITIVLLIFALFFILLDTSNYITNQIMDIITLRNMGITKAAVIHTYAIKLFLKLLPSFIAGFIISILCTYYLKTFNYQTSFMFEVTPITLILSFVIGAITLSITIYCYLLKRFSSTASTLKTKNKI
ncbi:MAG: ABC transporter ATP-binding protein/permease [Anaeroplasmataceae bacterium]|nr:ABC transporter ATP-binding protein/permease [Anaeroplasmataceae bacterium]MDE6413887.1 ABC transporter ATP-binding protein/permease [Anaeroplasmataceae bacterium]